MESNVLASTTPIPSNPQVIILSSHHHSMLLLLNRSSEANGGMHNPHSLCFIELHIDNHESLNTQFTNLIESFITINNLISLFTPITQPIHDSDNQIHSLSINNTHRSIQWLISYTMSINPSPFSLIIRIIRTQFIHSHDNEYNRFKREGVMMEHSSHPTDQFSQSLFSTQ